MCFTLVWKQIVVEGCVFKGRHMYKYSAVIIQQHNINYILWMNQAPSGLPILWVPHRHTLMEVCLFFITVSCTTCLRFLPRLAAEPQTSSPCKSNICSLRILGSEPNKYQGRISKKKEAKVE